MTFTDERAAKLLRDADCWQLDEMIADVDPDTEDEYAGRSDMDILREYAEWAYERYSDMDTRTAQELKHARYVKKRTEGWKTIPISIITFRPLPGYDEHGIRYAQGVIAEYERLQKLVRILRKG